MTESGNSNVHSAQFGLALGAVYCFVIAARFGAGGILAVFYLNSARCVTESVDNFGICMRRIVPALIVYSSVVQAVRRDPSYFSVIMTLGRTEYLSCVGSVAVVTLGCFVTVGLTGSIIVADIICEGMSGGRDGHSLQSGRNSACCICKVQPVCGILPVAAVAGFETGGSLCLMSDELASLAYVLCLFISADRAGIGAETVCGIGGLSGDPARIKGVGDSLAVV